MMPPVKPIAIKERRSVFFVQRCQVDVKDGAFVLIDKTGIRKHVPVGGLTCLLLEPGTRISHAAVALAARAGTLLLWVGEGGVRLYAAGQPGGARSDRLLWQAQLALDEKARLKVVRKMFELRFGEPPPRRRSVDQLRGMEGARVRKMYKQLAQIHRVPWQGRVYNPKAWGGSDLANRCLSAGTACLYGICEAAILAAGYAPAIGFLHFGKPKSFVYDIADIYKFETVVPAAFEVAKKSFVADAEREVRQKCRDAFRKSKLLKRLIPDIHEILEAGGIDLPDAPADAQPIAIPEESHHGDDGHRG